jgi:hypothetical protein
MVDVPVMQIFLTVMLHDQHFLVLEGEEVVDDSVVTEYCNQETGKSVT